jgi:hypothetical protein
MAGLARLATGTLPVATTPRIEEDIVVSDHLPTNVLAGIGPAVAGVPVWEAVIVLGLAAAIIVVALRGRPRRSSAEMSASDEAEVAIIDEIRGVDDTLSSHANGVLTLSTIAAGAFATVIKTYGSPGVPLTFATAIALLTCSATGAVGLALTGEATGAAALPTAELRTSVERNLRRAHRRTQCVRAATWSLFPSVLLVVISIVAVRH